MTQSEKKAEKNFKIYDATSWIKNKHKTHVARKVIRQSGNEISPPNRI